MMVSLADGHTYHMMISMTGMFSSGLAASPIALAICVPPILKQIQQTQNQAQVSYRYRSSSRQTESPPPPGAQLNPADTMREALGVAFPLSPFSSFHLSPFPVLLFPCLN